MTATERKLTLQAAQKKDGGVPGDGASSRDGAACRQGRVGALPDSVDETVLRVRDSNLSDGRQSSTEATTGRVPSKKRAVLRS
jgi:hypothetical protein